MELWVENDRKLGNYSAKLVPLMHSNLPAVLNIVVLCQCMSVSVHFGHFHADYSTFLSRRPFVAPSSVSEIHDVKLATF